MPKPRAKRKSRSRQESSAPHSERRRAEGSEAEGRAGVRRGAAAPERLRIARALLWGTLVALSAAVLTGILRKWVWILALQPIAIGVVIGETAAVPTSSRRRRPPAWSYAYVFLLCGFAYLLAHIVFWVSSSGLLPAQSFTEFLRAAPSATATPFFQSVDFARYIALATGGATVLKYWLWVAEGLLMAVAGALAYRGGSIRRLRS